MREDDIKGQKERWRKLKARKVEGESLTKGMRNEFRDDGREK